MRNIKLFGAAAVMTAVTLASCADNKSVVGEWIQPVPGMESMTQGIKLEDGGKASSINMATLQYETWAQDGNKLILSGKSIGNGQTISFSDTLEISKLTETDLVLKADAAEIAYTRQK